MGKGFSCAGGETRAVQRDGGFGKLEDLRVYRGFWGLIGVYRGFGF